MDPVGTTSLWVAGLRARESERADRMFEDPFARALAGEAGFAVIERLGDEGRYPYVEVRTRFLDDRLAAITERGLRQVVMLAAGMDARAYRLPWPPGVRLFEIDRPEILSHKASALQGATPRCERHALPIDLRDDWGQALIHAGFRHEEPTVFLLEGLLVYLDEAFVGRLFERVDALACPSSVVLFDLVGTSFLTSPYTNDWIERMVKLGAPWVFGTDDPEALIAPRGWDVTVTLPAEIGTRLGRWPGPVIPRSMPGVPHSFFVEAWKRSV